MSTKRSSQKSQYTVQDLVRELKYKLRNRLGNYYLFASEKEIDNPNITAKNKKTNNFQAYLEIVEWTSCNGMSDNTYTVTILDETIDSDDDEERCVFEHTYLKFTPKVAETIAKKFYEVILNSEL